MIRNRFFLNSWDPNTYYSWKVWSLHDIYMNPYVSKVTAIYNCSNSKSILYRSAIIITNSNTICIITIKKSIINITAYIDSQLFPFRFQTDFVNYNVNHHEINTDMQTAVPNHYLGILVCAVIYVYVIVACMCFVCF